jgi:pimeloyl-ACP methyl ester carboxylesterase
MSTVRRAFWRDPNLGARQVITLPQGRLAVFEAGRSGPPVVFIHGFATNANLWRTVVAELSRHHRCITIDLPLGSHEFPMPDADLTPRGLAQLVLDVIDHLELSRPVLVASDTGGVVSQFAAVTRSDAVRGLVLTSCDAYQHFPPPPFGFLSSPVLRIPGVLRLAGNLARWPLLLRLPIAYGWLAAGPIPQQVTDTYLLPLAASGGVRADLQHVVKGYDTRYTRELAHRYPQILHRVLIAWSRDDKCFPASDAERLADDLPNARVQWIENSYALSAEDQPQQLAEAVAGFVATL